MFISLFLFAFFSSSGHRRLTPWSHFSEGRTWIPFPLHNHGKLRHIHHICVFDSWRWNLPPPFSWASERRTADSLKMPLNVMAKQTMEICGSASKWIILLMSVTFESPTLCIHFDLFVSVVYEKLSWIEKSQFFLAFTDYILFSSEVFRLYYIVCNINIIYH